MQFKRIQVLMIILFIAVDLFLFNWWRSGRQSDTQVTNASSNVIQEMRRQKIDLPQFSNKREYANYIAAKPDYQFDETYQLLPTYSSKIRQNTLEVQFSQRHNIQLPTQKVAKKIANAQGYQHNALLTQLADDQSYYSQTMAGLPVLSVGGQLIFSYNRKQELTRFTQTKVTHIKRLRDERVTITEKDALIDLYQFNELNNGDVVGRGLLGYDTQLTVNGYDIYLPVWIFVVTHSNGKQQLVKINAFTGENLTS